MQIVKIIKIQFTQPSRFLVAVHDTSLNSSPFRCVCMCVRSFAFLSFGLFYFNDNKCCSFSVELVEQANTHSHTLPRNLHAQNHTRSLRFLYKLIKSIVASICTAIEFVSNNIISTWSEHTVCNCYSSNYLAGCVCLCVKKQFTLIFDLVLLARTPN